MNGQMTQPGRLFKKAVNFNHQKRAASSQEQNDAFCEAVKLDNERKPVVDSNCKSNDQAVGPKYPKRA